MRKNERLYWHTVSPLLKSSLTKLTADENLKFFRLVGGTSLSLQLGHRRSDDIDLFTDAEYGSVDFDAIDGFLRKTFRYVSEPVSGPVRMGRSYLTGNNKNETVKLDLYYTEKFIQPPLLIQKNRLATIEEIIAMKIDIVQRGARKKDFWDLHELLEKYPVNRMIELHEQRYPDSHDSTTIRKNFVNFANADYDFNPVCLKGKYWELIKLDISNHLQ